MALEHKEDYAMLKNKFPKLAVLSLLGVLALTACDEEEKIYCKPHDYKGTIVTIDGYTEEIHNNVLKIIYDDMHDGEVPSKTLDKVMYRFAQSVYGSYNKLTLSDNDESITLKEAVANYRSNQNATQQQQTSYEVIDAFIKAHKSYWKYDNNGVHVQADGVTPVDEKNFQPCDEERTNVDSKWDDIEDRIAENMYNKISSGSYSSKHFFDEVKLVRSLYQDGQDVDYESASAVYVSQGKAINVIQPQILNYTLEGKDVFTTGVLHRDFYQTKYGLGEDETEPYVDVTGREYNYHYIEDEIISEVYNDLLVEQYLLDEEVAAVRNSRARLINVIKIEKDSNTLNADALIKKLVEEIYSVVPAKTAAHLDYVTEEDNPFEAIFEKYERLSKGLYKELSSEEKAILASINARSSDVYHLVNDPADPAYDPEKKTYYENTAYGDLSEEYEKFLEAQDKGFEYLDKDLWNKYSNNGTTTYEEGFDQEVIGIEQTKAITKGWFVQKNAPSLDSGSKITDRLFQLSVANAKIEINDESYESKIQEVEMVDRIVKDPTSETGWKTRDQAASGRKDDQGQPIEGTENKYICSINGAYFLKFEGAYTGDDYRNDIVLDDGSAYYVVQVIEAVKDVKLRNSSSDNSYARTRSQTFLNDVIARITRAVAETGNYSSLSKEHWLKEMSIKYHDKEVYKYFKSNYPDLFDDED